MKTRILRLALLICLMVPVLTIPAKADSGPKPQVIVNFSGLRGETYYVTLLADNEGGCPYGVEETCPSGVAEKDIWQKFNDYGAEGWYFWGNFSDCSKDHQFSWTYYPPERFRILMYFPEYDQFLISGPCEQFAFESAYRVSFPDGALRSMLDSGAELSVKENHVYKFGAFLLRVVVTLVLELLVALVFRIRSRSALLIIGVTNLVTQVALNLVLCHLHAMDLWILMYVLLEGLVLFAEGWVYQHTITKEYPKFHPYEYATLANFLSFLAGFFLPALPML